MIRLSENEDFQVHKGIIFWGRLFNNPPRLYALVVIQIFNCSVHMDSKYIPKTI